MKAVVLCAGKGTRLGPLTATTPKPLLMAAGRPLLAWILDHLRRHGVLEVAINLHTMPDAIRAEVGDGSRFGLAVTWFSEPALLGTAGALAPMRAFLAGQTFLVQYGDVVTDHDLSSLMRIHRERDAVATLVVHRRAGSNSALAIDGEGRITAFLERPADSERGAIADPWVNSGIACCSPSILDAIPAGRASDLPRDVFIPLIGGRRCFAHPLTGSRVAVDGPDRLRMLDDQLRAGCWLPGSRDLPRTP